MKNACVILTSLMLIALSASAKPITSYSGPAATQINALIAENAASCSEEGGTQTVAYDQIVSDVDLNEDGKADAYFSFYATECSISPAYWSGSVGTQWSLFISNEAGGHEQLDMTARALKVVDFGGPVLLASLHGSSCGGAGLQPCIEAMVWDPHTKAFNSISGAYDDTPEPWELE